MGLGGSDSAAAAAGQLAQQQALIKKSVGGINDAFKGFDDAFYQKRANDYTAYALPQLNQQFQDIGKNLDYRLADAGLNASSAGQQARGALDKNYALKKQSVVDTGQQQAQQLQQQVQGQKNQLISEAQTAADPSQVAASAIGTASGFTAPSTFAPLGQLFGDFSNVYLANQYAKSVQPYLAGGNPLLNRGATTGMNSSAINNYTLN